MLNRNWYFVLIGIIFTITACTTSKNTALRRFYHNTTAKYNVYFNGNESFKKGAEKVRKNYDDNYTEIIPIFRYSDKVTNQSASGDMNKAIEKGQKLIKLHSLTVKPKRPRGSMSPKQKELYQKREYCNWVDEAYLLMGKANFYNQDFIKSIKSLKYVEQRFSEEPTKNEALLWIARIHIEKKEYRDAKAVLDQIKGNDLKKKMKIQLALTYADYHLRQQEYPEALKMIERANELIRWKKKKTRNYFIMAQIYQKTGKNTQALELYKKVIKMNPPYEMAFNAKINMATAFSGGNSGDIKKTLRKMIKDDKNIDYLDQIYFALGEITIKEQDTVQAIDYYTLSTAKSIDNDDQKALSCLALADIYFQKPDYNLSEAYYDSTMTFLDPEYPDYKQIEKRAKILKNLINNYKEVQLQDSLQRMANMDEQSRLKYIDKIINDIKRKEAEEKRRQQAAMNNNSNYNPQEGLNRNRQSGGKWYFYNPTLVSFGIADFQKRWGKRKLEDNWRRMNKAIVISNETDTAGTGVAGEEIDTLNPKMREYYLRDLPLTDSTMAVSHQKIIRSLLKMGEIYSAKLQAYKESNNVYQELNKRYPKNKFLVETYYYTYLNYKAINDKTNADKYKTKIINEYPNSKYAKLFTNPNFLTEYLAEQKQIETLYQKSFNAYKTNNYSQVISFADKAEANYPDNELIPRFAYLRTMSKAALKMYDAPKLIEELEKIKETTQQSEVIQIIENTIEILEETPEAIAAEEAIYFDKPENNHLYIMLIKDTTEIVPGEIKFKLTKFNIENFADISFSEKMDTTSLAQKIIIVNGLPNKEKSRSYFEKLNAENLFRDIPNSKYSHFLITKENYNTLTKEKELKKYMRFYKENYK